MKTININSSYPGFADDFITYEGSLDTVRSGYLPYGVGGSAYSEFTITTEIINNLVATFRCVASSGQLRDNSITRSNILSDVLKSFELPYKLAKIGDRTNVIVRVPHGCVCNYSITGQKCLGSDLEENEEVVETQAFFTEGFSAFGHSHDGVDGRHIQAGELSPNPGQAGKFLRVSSDGTRIIYSDASTGTLGLFNLTTPANRTEFDITNPLVTFTWEESTDATSYRIIVVRNSTGQIVYNLAGYTGLTLTTPANFLFAQEHYSWYVIATDGTYFLSSSVNHFVTSAITDYYIVEGVTLTDSNGTEAAYSSGYLASKAMREVLKTGYNYKVIQAIPTIEKVIYINVRQMTGAATSVGSVLTIPMAKETLNVTLLDSTIATDTKDDINSCRNEYLFDPNAADVTVVTDYAGLVAALAGADTKIRVTTGFALTDNVTLVNGKTVYFDDVTITSALDKSMFRDNGVACVANIYGYGTFNFTNVSSNHNILRPTHHSSVLWMKFKAINYQGTFAAFYTFKNGVNGEGGNFKVKGKTLISATRLFDSDNTNPILSMDIVTVTTGEFMFPATDVNQRIYLKNMFITATAFGDLEGSEVTIYFNWIGVFFKNTGGYLACSAGGTLIIRLFNTYIETATYFLYSGISTHYLIGYNSLSNKGNEPLNPINETNFIVDPTFTLTDLT